MVQDAFHAVAFDGDYGELVRLPGNVVFYPVSPESHAE